MANGITQAALWAAVFTPTADEIAREIVQQEWEMRQEEEKAYWIGWDRAAKAKVVERLRNHEAGFNLLRLNGEEIYPNLTQDIQADLIENGELKIVDTVKGIGAMWADENREEAKNPKYLEKLEKIKGYMAEGQHRIIS